MSLITRRAKESDLCYLNSMMYKLHDEHHQQCPALFKTAAEIEEQKSISLYLHDPECLVYVAEYDGNIIGFATAHFCQLISTISKPVMMATIDELYVELAYRRKNVAQQLMQQIEQELKDYGVKEIFVEVWHFNQGALNFYQQQGLKNHIHYLRKPLYDEII